MRAALCLLALTWALVCVHASGNYKYIRRYLWVMCADILVGAVYLRLWPLHGWAWIGVYALLTAAIACTAALVAWQGLQSLPPKYRAYMVTVASLAAVIAVGVQWAFVGDPPSRVTLVAGGLMFPIGILTLCSSLVVDVLHDSAFRTLGLLWSAQGFMFFLFAAGAQLHPATWAGFGEWLPAVVFISGMIALGMDFKDVGLAELNEQARG